jgi:Family of unknown function (DUF6343)
VGIPRSVTAPIGEPEPRRTREDYARGLPDHHDPTAGIGGAAPAQSALTLRLVLAVFGLVVCLGGGLVVLATPLPLAFAVVLLGLAAVAAVDLVVILRRKARGEPG